MTQHTRELIVLRRLAAPPDRVYEAFIDPGLLVRWMGPRGTSLAACAVDARVGGRFRFELAFDGGGSVVLTGAYRDLDPGRRLAFTWGIEGEADDSEVAVHLAPFGTGTELRLEHRGLAMHELEQNEAGWNEFFDRLEMALA
ncbi:MAG: SRPBCC domain-containing protein [Dehalococcoidia bacterium]